MTKKTASTKPAARLTVAMEVGMGNPNAETDALDALLADLGQPTGGEEIIEAAGSEEILESVVGELELESAAPTDDEAHEAEAERLLREEALVDTGAAEVVEIAEAEAAKDAKAALKAKKKADQEAARAAAATKRKEEREAKAAARAAAAAAKPAPVPRKHYASKVERVSDKLGEHLGDYTVLTLSDAQLTGDELKAKQQETLDVLSKAGVKVQNRMTLLLEFVAGKSSKLNEVIARAFTLLHKDGHIKTGDKGNLHENLLSKPYSPSAARAMGNNTIAAMRDFKVIVKDEEGKYVANPESLILMKVNGMMELS